MVEDPTMRQLYSTSMLGPYVQIFVLDYRRGYLGKDQVLWLTEALTNSTARFKIIMAGTPFGVSTEGSVTVAKSRDSVTKVCTEAISGREKEREGSSGTVSMLIPPPVAALGWDESGRLNLSLPAVIAAYQLLCIKRNSDKRDEMESRQSNSEEVSTAQRMDLGSERDSCDMNIDIVGSQRSDAFEESNIPSPHSAQTDIESGILILSAGACIPLALGKPGEATAVSEVTSALEQKRKSLSNSNDSLDKRRPPLALSSSRSGSLRTLSVLKGLEGDLIEWNKEDSNVSPFAAVYDPCGSGKPICFEVSVGSCGDNGEERSLTGVIPSLSPALPPVLLPYLGGKLLYTTPVRVPLENSGGKSLDTFSAVVSLSEDGYSLDLRLLLFQPDQEHSVLFKHRLRIPH